MADINDFYKSIRSKDTETEVPIKDNSKNRIITNSAYMNTIKKGSDLEVLDGYFLEKTDLSSISVTPLSGSEDSNISRIDASLINDEINDHSSSEGSHFFINNVSEGTFKVNNNKTNNLNAQELDFIDFDSGNSELDKNSLSIPEINVNNTFSVSELNNYISRDKSTIPYNFGFDIEDDSLFYGKFRAEQTYDEFRAKPVYEVSFLKTFVEGKDTAFGFGLGATLEENADCPDIRISINEDDTTTIKTTIKSNKFIEIDSNIEIKISIEEENTELVFKMNGIKDWGDGSADTATSHTYATPGTYNVLCDGTSLGNYVFGDDTNNNISEVNILKNITSIGDYAFYGCSGLTSITIGDSVASIGDSAFNKCSSLQSITLPFVGGNKSATSASASTLFGYIFGTNSYDGGTETEQHYGAGAADYSTYYIPSSLKSLTITGGNILYGAFYNCSNLTNIIILDNVTSIGHHAFRNCSGLTYIGFKGTVSQWKYIEKAIDWKSNAPAIAVHCTDGVDPPITVVDISINSGQPFTFNMSGSKEWGDGTIDDATTHEYAAAGEYRIICNGTAIGPFSSTGLFGQDSSNRNDTVENIIIGEENITKIGSNAFYNCIKLTSVTIGNSVTSIGNNVFKGCTGLTSITIPDSVTSIGSDTFRDCTGLTSVTIGNSVTSIGSYAFAGCTGLTSMTTPNSMTRIGLGAFYNCSGLTSVTIGNGVTDIGSDTFHGCAGLTSITIPDSVASIGSDTFYDCTGLTSVTIGNSVTSIGDNVFSRCSSLTSITIPNSVTSIGEGAFSRCSSLTSITIPNTVTSIGWGAFDGCTGLTSITIPNGVTSIEPYTFDGCTGLTNITIPNSVIYIDGFAFRDCSGLTSIEIPDSVESIGSYAFTHCSGLTGIIIPDSVIYIGSDAFSYCNGLTSVTIGNGVTDINEGAFISCYGLTSVTIGNSVKSIGEAAFTLCYSLTNITIPNSVTRIDDYAFYYCSGLTYIEFKGTISQWNSIIKGENWKDGVPAIAVRCTDGVYPAITVVDISINSGQPFTFNMSGSKEWGDGTIDDRKTHTYAAAGEYRIICDGTEIGPFSSTGLFGQDSSNQNDTVENVIIGEDILQIGSNAFTYCTGLTSITIPNSVTSIGGSAFSGCSRLTRVTIPNSVTSIESYTFSGCRGLTSIRIPTGVTSIGNRAFQNCSGLTSITIPTGVTSIGDHVFYYCIELRSVTIGSGVTSIGNYAFEGCSLLTNITFEDTTTWYRTTNQTDWQQKKNGTQTSVTNASNNAILFKSTFKTYYLYKSE